MKMIFQRKEEVHKANNGTPKKPNFPLVKMLGEAWEFVKYYRSRVLSYNLLLKASTVA